MARKGQWDGWEKWDGGSKVKRRSKKGSRSKGEGAAETSAPKIPKLTAKQWEAIEIAFNRESRQLLPEDGVNRRVIEALLTATDKRPALIEPLGYVDGSGTAFYLNDEGLQAYNRRNLHRAKINELNDKWADVWAAHGDPRYQFQREGQIAGTENEYVYDFICHERQIAIEIQGGVYAEKGGHTSITGYERDCRKQNQAAAAGYRVLAFTSGMIKRDPEGCAQIVIEALRIL